MHNLSISAKDFAAELKTNKTVVVIDVQAADVYAKQHIQGAINIPHKSLYKPSPIEGQFLLTESWQPYWVKRESAIPQRLCLDDGSQKYNSRVWWVLRYMGATDVIFFIKGPGRWEQRAYPMMRLLLPQSRQHFSGSVNEA